MILPHGRKPGNDIRSQLWADIFCAAFDALPSSFCVSAHFSLDKAVFPV